MTENGYTFRDVAGSLALIFGIMFILAALEAWDGGLLLTGAALTAAGLMAANQ